ncbi:hypothetical protein CTI12_AA421160 [Artemisia annua]|uniref:Uncharacterized protein n=1 Tax=Artemisia annua TaxID=35608 RepID=A0A2U1M4K7_ARTAN|nr:hypothetical protein CTI12_AA421160 [Artemisia annua]
MLNIKSESRMAEKIYDDVMQLLKDALPPHNKLARNSGNVDSQIIKDVASGPLRSVVTYPVYFVNGYKFHTSEHGSGRLTYNSGVCLKGSNYSDESTDYYGILVEIVQLDLAFQDDEVNTHTLDDADTDDSDDADTDDSDDASLGDDTY